MSDHRYDPDPPECVSQIWGEQLARMYRARAEHLRREGNESEAQEMDTLAIAYGGFRRLVQ